MCRGAVELQRLKLTVAVRLADVGGGFLAAAAELRTTELEKAVQSPDVIVLAAALALVGVASFSGMGRLCVWHDPLLTPVVFLAEFSCSLGYQTGGEVGALLCMAHDWKHKKIGKSTSESTDGLALFSLMVKREQMPFFFLLFFIQLKVHKGSY